MERLFVRILNVALLVAGFVALLGTLGALALLCLNGYPALFAETENRQLTIHYQPLSTVSAITTVEGATVTSTGDRSLKRAAELACDAENRLTLLLSNNALQRTVSSCVSNYLNGQSYDREVNQLEQLAGYMDAARSDPQIKSKYPPTNDKETLAKYLAELETNFNTAFAKAADADDARKAKAAAEAAEARAVAAIWGAAAVSMFISFLFVAFLIVAIRIEKHLGNMEQKLQSTG
jgi:hypothetical protein